MRRFFVLLLAALMLLSFAACGAAPAAAEVTVPVTTQAVTQPTETTVPETTAVPETTEATEPLPPAPVFDLLVRTKTLSQYAERQIRDLKENNQYPVKHLWIDDVPIIIVVGEGDGPKPIYLYLHPAGDRKDNHARDIYDIAMETGGIAVALDSGGSGNSPRGKMTGTEAFTGAVSDIDKVIAYCSTIEGADLSRISLEGESLGGTTIMAYMSKGIFKPAFVHAMVPNADFPTFAKNTPAYLVGGIGNRIGKFLTHDQIFELLCEYNPMDHTDRMMDTFMMISSGLQDADVGTCQALEAKFQELGKENCRFDYYDCGHSLPEEEVMPIARTLWRLYGVEGEGVRNPVPEVTITEQSW